MTVVSTVSTVPVPVPDSRLRFPKLWEQVVLDTPIRYTGKNHRLLMIAAEGARIRRNTITLIESDNFDALSDTVHRDTVGWLLKFLDRNNDGLETAVAEARQVLDRLVS